QAAAVRVEQCDARGVVAAVFEAAQTFEDDATGRPLAGVTDDPTHGPPRFPWYRPRRLNSVTLAPLLATERLEARHRAPQPLRSRISDCPPAARPGGRI